MYLQSSVFTTEAYKWNKYILQLITVSRIAAIDPLAM